MGNLALDGDIRMETEPDQKVSGDQTNCVYKTQWSRAKGCRKYISAEALTALLVATS